MSLEAVQLQTNRQKAATPTPTSGLLQRKCACGNHTVAGGECAECGKKRLQRKVANHTEPEIVPPIVHEVLRSPGQPLDPTTRAFMEPRFGHDLSRVRVHAYEKAAESARAVNALAYTVGRDLVFGTGQYVPETNEGKKLLAHELAHALQQGQAQSAGTVVGYASTSSAEEPQADAIADAVLAGHPRGPVSNSRLMIQRRAAPYIKKITVHLTPPQTADLEWKGTPPADAVGSDHFTVSTGKGYGDPGDPPGTCKRNCCSDPMTQCAPPWNKPTNVGACCTYYGDNYWTGRPREEHNGWKWWTPIQPYYSSRGIALHQHHEVTGQPIGHGCVRMDEPNAKRIYDYSNGQQTNVTIDGRAAPVACEANRQCGTDHGASGSLEEGLGETRLAADFQEVVPGLEGVMT